jgi:predicted O-methyltransferase YrrM
MRELLHIPRDSLRKVRRTTREFLSGPSLTQQGVLKLRSAVFLEAVGQAPPRNRIRIFQRSFPSLFTPAPASSDEVCEFNSLESFASSYADLAAKLGRRGKTPPPGETEFFQTITNRGPAYEGRIGTADFLFLSAVVSVLAPTRVVEIGTLTGFSAAIIAAALRRQHPEEGAAWVDTIDVKADCLIDEKRPTGFEIFESFSELAPMIRLHIPHDSSVISELAERDELDFAFIDADHRHPMPLLDLLRLAPYLKREAWVVLHDIRLGTLGSEARKAGHLSRWVMPYGAEWLFQHWPFRKISSGNIGAIQLPRDRSALIAFALRLMSIPFEDNRVRITRAALHQSFEKLI